VRPEKHAVVWCTLKISCILQAVKRCKYIVLLQKSPRPPVIGTEGAQHTELQQCTLTDPSVFPQGESNSMPTHNPEANSVFPMNLQKQVTYNHHNGTTTTEKPRNRCWFQPSRYFPQPLLAFADTNSVSTYLTVPQLNFFRSGMSIRSPSVATMDCILLLPFARPAPVRRQNQPIPKPRHTVVQATLPAL
jgi:hypothetical protein